MSEQRNPGSSGPDNSKAAYVDLSSGKMLLDQTNSLNNTTNVKPGTVLRSSGQVSGLNSLEMRHPVRDFNVNKKKMAPRTCCNNVAQDSNLNNIKF